MLWKMKTPRDIFAVRIELGDSESAFGVGFRENRSKNPAVLLAVHP
jgi:hypothetical protein